MQEHIQERNPISESSATRHFAQWKHERYTKEYRREPYKCKQCDKAFSQAVNQEAHERTHTGEKPCKCKQCDRAFSGAGSLKIHERVHAGEKSYKCKQCDKAFSKAVNRKTHERTNTAEKP